MLLSKEGPELFSGLQGRYAESPSKLSPFSPHSLRSWRGPCWLEHNLNLANCLPLKQGHELSNRCIQRVHSNITYIASHSRPARFPPVEKSLPSARLNRSSLAPKADRYRWNLSTKSSSGLSTSVCATASRNWP